jgi:hypothetical protein
MFVHVNWKSPRRFRALPSAPHRQQLATTLLSQCVSLMSARNASATPCLLQPAPSLFLACAFCNRNWTALVYLYNQNRPNTLTSERMVRRRIAHIVGSGAPLRVTLSANAVARTQPDLRGLLDSRLVQISVVQNRSLADAGVFKQGAEGSLEATPDNSLLGRSK